MQPPWGRTIQQRREARDWSIRWAAQQAGMSDVFWAQMERGYKRNKAGDYITVTPSLGSLLQAAAALRLNAREIDDLIQAAGHEPLPRRYLDGNQPAGVIEAIEEDPALIEEAKVHLLNQYELLLRLSPAPSVAGGKQTPRRATTPDAQPLRAVARGGDPKDRAEVSRLARKAREEHEREARGKKK